MLGLGEYTASNKTASKNEDPQTFSLIKKATCMEAT